MLLPVNDTTVEKRLTIFGARISYNISPINYDVLADFPSTRRRVGGLHITPPSLVQGRGEEGLAAARQGRPASTRGRSRQERGLPEVRLEAVYGDRRWRAADVHHEVLVAGDPDAVRTAIGWRQARRQRGRPHVNEGGGAESQRW
jgi:hypothetical protein